MVRNALQNHTQPELKSSEVQPWAKWHYLSLINLKYTFLPACPKVKEVKGVAGVGCGEEWSPGNVCIILNVLCLLKVGMQHFLVF